MIATTWTTACLEVNQLTE